MRLSQQFSSLTALVLITSTNLLSPMAKANSAIFAGGPFYKNQNQSLTELKASGFNTVIVWTIHIDADGSLNINGELPLVSKGRYIGEQRYPGFQEAMASLKEAPTSVTRTEFGLGSAGSGTYTHIKALLNCKQPGCGNKPGSTLYQNFNALKQAFPSVDAVNNDDEVAYDLDSAVTFHTMLADIGFKISATPYRNQSFWQGFFSQLNAINPGSADALYVQEYIGGESNNPCDWDFGVPVYPGIFSDAATPAGVHNQMQLWKNTCGHTVKGGFMWMYDYFNNSRLVKEYANSINTVFEHP